MTPYILGLALSLFVVSVAVAEINNIEGLRVFNVILVMSVVILTAVYLMHTLREMPRWPLFP